MSSEVEAHITKKYEIKKRLGKGAYGIVWKAIDRKTGEVVALKKIFDAFRNQTDAQRTFREIMFLQEFGDHPNIITLLDVFRAENDKDIYLVFEFMDTDLHQVIKRGNILRDIHKRYIMYQLFKATKYLHSGGVIHRDQKPSNVLLDGECVVKMCDFGLARSLSQLKADEQTSDPNLTEYVATRWYRAPEILLASHKYTNGVDMWSLGCILAEMLTGKPLFPGTSTLNQLEKIMSCIPLPSRLEIEAINSSFGPSILEKVASKPRNSLQNMLPHISEDALDLVTNLLHFKPERRLTADQCLAHPYVARFRNPQSEPVVGRQIVLPLSDDIQLSVHEYRTNLYRIMAERKAERRQHRKEVLASNIILEADINVTPTGSTRSNYGITGEITGDRKTLTRDNKCDTKGNDENHHGNAEGDRLKKHTSSKNIGAVEVKRAQKLNSQHKSTSLKRNQNLGRRRSFDTGNGKANVTRSPLTEARSSRHHETLHTGHSFMRRNDNPVILRDERSYSASQAIIRKADKESTSSAKHYGRRMFNNTRNNSSSGAPKALFGSYNQTHGTITAAGLAAIQSRKF